MENEKKSLAEKKDILIPFPSSVFRKYGFLLPLTLVAIVVIGFVLYTVLYSDFPSPAGPGTLWNVNESWVQATLMHVVEAQDMYKSEHGKYATLEELTEWYDGPWMDVKRLKRRTPEKPAEGRDRGYYFISSANEKGWSVTAIPSQPGVTGKRSFYVDETGMFRCAPCEKHDDPPADKNTSDPYVPSGDW